VDYETDLRRELENAQAECVRLREENTRLRERLLTHEQAHPFSYSTETPLDNSLPIANSSESRKESSSDIDLVTNLSAPDAKIALFRKLFRGRDDVYAVHWKGRNGRSGYSPAAQREPNDAFKTPDHKNRKYFPLTDAVIRNHLLGKQTVGIYPLLLDETCWFLAIDFDKQAWQTDASAFITTCERIGLPAVLERSRSGNGGHVWLFFESPLSACTARRLGCYLLTTTMERRHSIGLDSYDRLFPNQDTLPKGGFGNLIALPLQRGPRELGNSVFIDNNFMPYVDQWAFLSTIRKIAADEIETILSKVTSNGAIIGVRTSSTHPEAIDGSWMMPAPDENADPAIVDQSSAMVRATRRNLIYIEKQNLSSSFLNRLIRLAAFQNPEFYRAQAMRLSTFGKPRVISCAEEFPHDIALPRGSLDDALDLFETHRIRAEIDDQRFSGNTIAVSFRGKLTGLQMKAAMALLAHDEGILCAPTAFGKTVVAAYLLAKRKTNTLILVHRRHLLEQWKDRLESFLELYETTKIGQIGGGRKSHGLEIDVAVMQSLIRKGEVNSLLGEYGQIIVDECHHVSAFTFERILRHAKAKYVLGLTATPIRKDGHHPIIVMQCGPIRFNLSAKKLGATQTFDHVVTPRFTHFSVPPEWSEISIQDLYTALALDEQRTDQVVSDVLEAVREGRSPLVLTERKDHLRTIAEKLEGRVENLFVLRGGAGKKTRDDLFQRLSNVHQESARVILATGKYIGEGFDDARLDTLFLAMPISWRGILQQYVGRLHRVHENKRVVHVYDYVDYLVPVLARMYDRRVSSYKSIGYVIDESAKAPKRSSDLAFAEIERTAIQAVTDYESSRGWQVQTVEAQTHGFDLISLNARTEDRRSNAKGLSDNQRRFIEVKGRAHRGPISLSANEYSVAKRLGTNYWLYVVFNCASSPEILAIQDPARLNWKPLSKIEQYQVGASELLKTRL